MLLNYVITTSLVAQMAKRLPAMRETWVRSLGWEDPLEENRANHSSILAWRNLWTVSSVQFSYSVVSDSLRPHGLQHARPRCPSPIPGVH